MTRSKFIINFVVSLLSLGVAVGLGAYAFNEWKNRQKVAAASKDAPPKAPIADGNTPVRISAEARKNLGVLSKPLQLSTYFRKIEVPGVITDRPGISDRGVVAPVTGIVTKIHAYPGSTVAPNAPLFALRLVSESLHTSQLELFKATKEIEIARQQQKRLEGLADMGGIAGSRLIEIENQVKRMDVNVLAYRQDLKARGLSEEQIEAAAKGDFVAEITVTAPGEQALKVAEVALASAIEGEPARLPFSFELQTLKVELGQQIEAGQLLCTLADHRALLIEGQGFKKDMPLIQRTAKEQLPINVGFEVEEGNNWPALPKELQISVHVLHEDSTSVVIANDGGPRKGSFVAQNAAASLNRVLKAQLASGIPTNVHVHADGTTHEAH